MHNKYTKKMTRTKKMPRACGEVGRCAMSSAPGVWMLRGRRCMPETLVARSRRPQSTLLTARWEVLVGYDVDVNAISFLPVLLVWNLLTAAFLGIANHWAKRISVKYQIARLSTALRDWLCIMLPWVIAWNSLYQLQRLTATVRAVLSVFLMTFIAIFMQVNH